MTMADENMPGPSEDDSGVVGGEDVPSHEKGTPPISADEQEKGKTSHPAPADDAGVPSDTRSQE
jgi:hypothetical protein